MENEIKLIGLGLAVGETARDVCPKCGGGSTNERTFTVSRTGPGELGFYCHRASCGTRGVVRTSGVVGSEDVVHTTKQSRWYTARSRPATNEERAWYLEKFGMELTDQVDVSTRRVMYRLLTFEGRTWGFLGRSYGHDKAKALTYWRDGDLPDQLAWCRRSYKHGKLPSVVLTEDVVSARKIGILTDAASLLGTHLSENKTKQLLAHVDKVYLALDPDNAGRIATARIVRELSSLLPVEVVQLTADPKDMNFNELGEALVRAKVIERTGIQPAGVQESREAAG